MVTSTESLASLSEESSSEVLDLLESLAAGVELADEPGGEFVGQVLHKPDSDMPFPTSTASLESAGWLPVWHTVTGELSVINANMLTIQLSKRLENGQRAFTTRDPGIIPFRGILKCFLHTDDDDRETWDQMGMPSCDKSNLPNQYQRLSHMLHRHKTEWGSIEERRNRQERVEDREYQRSTGDALRAMADALLAERAPAPPPVMKSTAPAHEIMPTVPAAVTPPRKYKRRKALVERVATCEFCDHTTTGGTQMVANNRMKTHSKVVHPNA